MIIISTNFLKWQMKIQYMQRIYMNIHILMTEIYKFINGLPPPIMVKTVKKKKIVHTL